MVTLSGNSTINLERTETNQMVVQRSKISGQSISCLPSFSNLQASGCPLYNSDLVFLVPLNSDRPSCTCILVSHLDRCHGTCGILPILTFRFLVLDLCQVPR